MTASPTSTFSDQRLALWERWFGVAMLIFIAVFRWRSISRFRIDSDEPQHLHVVWGWTQGLLQYRDFFDNHTPIFHIFYAPLLHLLGERADILVAMRIAELPLFALTLWCVYAVGKRLYDARVGWWAMLLTASEAMFFYTSLEFRADVLWTLLWMATLLVLLGSEGKKGRLLFAGVLLGATLGTSIKTAVLIVSFVAAGGCWLVLQKLLGGSIAWKKVSRGFFILVAGSLLIPLALAGYFYAKGGLQELVYCLFHHNTGSLTEMGNFQEKMLFFPVILLAALAIAWFFMRQTERPGLPFGRVFLLFGTTIYLGLLVSFWSLLTPFTNQDLLPFVPMLMLLLAPVLVWMSQRIKRLSPLIWTIVFCFLIANLLRKPAIQTPTPGKYERFLAIVLKLTGPNDFVMDAKGEAIFRNRPYYFCLETQTRRKIINGDLPDDIPERLITTRTALTRTNRLPDRAEAFVKKHYLRVGRGASVLGQDLNADATDGTHYSFTVGVPQRYVIVGKNGPVAGILNGVPYSGAVELSAGPHIFIRQSKDEPIALFWAKAHEAGFSAFTERKAEENEP